MKVKIYFGNHSTNIRLDINRNGEVTRNYFSDINGLLRYLEANGITATLDDCEAGW